jgi:hypothetical protein
MQNVYTLLCKMSTRCQQNILFRVGKDLQVLVLREYQESISISKEDATSFQRSEFKSFPVDAVKICTAFRRTTILP